MSKVSITRSKLDLLADAIGSKSSRGIPLTIDQMRDAVLDIEIGITPSGTKSITKNGTYDVTEYASTEVNVSVTEGGAYQDADGYIVLGEGESSAPQGNISITANGTYDVAQYASANVEVLSGLEYKEYLQRLIDRSITSITLPEPVDPDDVNACVGYDAFSNCSKLTSVVIPEGYKYIGQYAFQYCTSLISVTFPTSLTWVTNYCFYRCSSLALEALPDTFISIGMSAFTECTSLALTSLPSSLTSVGQNAFSGCTSLSISELPPLLTSIGSNAFSRCSGITSISSTAAISTLAGGAFNGNSTNPMALTSVSFPNMVLASNIGFVFGSTTAANACQQLAFCDIGSTTGIAASAFANCYALETLVLRKTASVCTLANVSAFLNTPMRGYDGKTGKVYVPSALIESYKTATNWKTLYNAGTVEFLAIEGSEYER